MKLSEFYINNLKKLQIIPIIILIISLGILSYNYFTTSEFLEKDVSLKGGSIITITTDKDVSNLESFLKSNFNADFTVRKLTEFGTSASKGTIIETNLKNTEDLKKALENNLNIKLTKDNFSIEVTEESLGKSFTSQIIMAMIIAFILMAIVIFIAFRALVPSMAVIFAAIFDMVVAMAAMNILNIKLSVSTAAAVLLLIGYSVDTDVLLTTKILKRKTSGSINERIFESIKTGFTMTFAAIAALSVGYFITNSFVMKSMFLVIIAGLVADLFSTWLVNVYILKLYVEKNG